MPFKSEAQRRYLWKKDPKLARRWTARYGSDPERSTQKRGAKRKGLLSRMASEGYRG